MRSALSKRYMTSPAPAPPTRPGGTPVRRGGCVKRTQELQVRDPDRGRWSLPVDHEYRCFHLGPPGSCLRTPRLPYLPRQVTVSRHLSVGATAVFRE